MPVAKPPKAPTIESMDGEFKTKTVKMRGITYTLKEIPADEYEKCLESATLEDDNGRQRIDNTILLKLMVGKALVEPKMTVAELWKKPYPVIRKINDLVEELHYTPEEEEPEGGEDEDKGEAEG